MKGNLSCRMTRGIATTAIFLFLANGASADAESEIRLLKAQMLQQQARLRKLEAQVRIQNQARKQAKAEIKNATNVANAVHAGADHETPPVFVSLAKGGLKIETEDGAYMFHVGGRMHLDGGVNTGPTVGRAGNAGIRRGRLELEGRFAHYWLWRLQYEFAGGAASTGVPGGLRDIFLGFKHPLFTLLPFTQEPVVLQVGQMFEPFGLEKATSSNFIDFVERAMAIDAFAPFRNVGVAAVAHGDNWTAKAGVFSTSLQQDPSLSPAPGVPVPLGVPAAAGWIPTGGGNYYDATGRLTYAPILEKERLLHFGASVRYHRPNDAIASTEARVAAPGLNLRAESNFLGENLTGTPDLSCGLLRGAAGRCIKDVVSYGAEISAAYGPFALQAEYIGAHYNRDATALARADALGAFVPGGTSLNFDGFYAYGAWYLTGESRAAAYNVSDLNGAGFGQIKIKSPVSAGGLGAVEIAARFSSINLNSGPLQGATYANLIALAPDAFTRSVVAKSGVIGGREQNVTVGLNWYPEAGVRFMANWTKVVTLSAPWNRPYLNGAHPNLFILRAQVDW